MVATVGWRLISSTCIEEMRNSSNRKVRIAHDNSLAKGGLNFRFACKLPLAPYILSSYYLFLSPSSFYYFCPPLVLPTSTGHSFRAIAMKLCRHITLGGIQSPSKNFGGQTPLGEIFSPNFFSRYRSENLPESCPRPRKK